MKLILVDDDGTLLDSTPVTPEQWQQAQRKPEVARMLLDELVPGHEALRQENDQ